MTILENLSMADNKGKSFNLKPGTDKRRTIFTAITCVSWVWGWKTSLMQPSALYPADKAGAGALMSTMTPIEFLILDEHTASLDPKVAKRLWN